jgi:hypothetical protein
MAIFPPLTTNEAAVFEALVFDSAVEFTAEMIAERTGLDEPQVERALRSLNARNPPLAIALSLAIVRWRSPFGTTAGSQPDTKLLA